MLVGKLKSILSTSTLELPIDSYYKHLKGEFGQEVVLEIDFMLSNKYDQNRIYARLINSINVRKMALLPTKMNVIHLQELMDHLIFDQKERFRLRSRILAVSSANQEPARKRQFSKAGSLDDSDGSLPID